MEEILASIRRIISDEEVPAAKNAAPALVEEELDIDDAFEAAEAEEDVAMSQDDLDKLFDMDSSDDDVSMDDDIGFAEDGAEDVLELTEELALDDDEADDFDMVEGLAESVDGDSGDIAFIEEDEDDAFEMPMPKPAPKPVMASKPVDMSQLDDLEEGEPLVSGDAGAAVHAAFENLSTTILSANARTLEDLVTDMLRPMLKNWLDQNLPVMVERLVRQEIERVSRRR
ncbi:PopZ family protein [Pannonibacter sp.]|uniref:PopZ family protein n=1 Tax=Pannonibacter sp. TaxID=1906786 RepID=UPI003F708EA7